MYLYKIHSVIRKSKVENVIYFIFPIFNLFINLKQYLPNDVPILNVLGLF